MIKIGFDARMVRHSGIGTYIGGILTHLTSNKDFDFTLFGDLVKIADYPAKKVLANFPIYSLQEQFFFPALLKKDPLDLLHVPHYNIPLGYRGNLVATVHDLIHLRFPPSRIAYFYARTMLGAVCRKTKIIIASSFNTKKDLIELVGADENKIRVIYPGVPDRFSKTITASSSSCDQKKGEQREEIFDYILYVGNIKPTKNIKTLMEAFRSAKKRINDLHLILVGKNFMPEYTKQFDENSQIQFLGEISHEKLTKIYRQAKLFVFPSLYEGFGFPPLEAMVSGVPVISSNAASLPEVVGNAAELFDPNNIEELANLICGLWEDKGKRDLLRLRGFEQVKKFSLEKCVDETAKVYREATG